LARTVWLDGSDVVAPQTLVPIRETAQCFDRRLCLGPVIILAVVDIPKVALLVILTSRLKRVLHVIADKAQQPGGIHRLKSRVTREGCGTPLARVDAVVISEEAKARRPANPSSRGARGSGRYTTSARDHLVGGAGRVV
jgi:hypothetical protein